LESNIESVDVEVVGVDEVSSLTRRAGNLNVSKTSTRPATKNRRQQQQVWYMITTTHDKLFVDGKDTHTEKEEVE
jgi:hypothetical protein